MNKLVYFFLLLALGSVNSWAQCEGGEVFIMGGATELTAPAGDDALDIIIETNSASNEHYVLVVTDDTDSLVFITDEDFLEASGAPVGVFKIYGASFSGDLDSNAEVLGDLTASGCFELSENNILITVTVPPVHGSEIYTSDYEDEIHACAGDDLLSFNVMNESQAVAPYAYIITDPQGNILGMPPGDHIDLTAAPPGLCLIVGFSYTGALDSSATHIDDLTSDGEYDFSENEIEVYRDGADGGEIFVDGGGDTLMGVAGSHELNFYVSNTSTSPSDYGYVVTDDEGNIIGWPHDDYIELSDAPVGMCYIYGFSYTGELDYDAEHIDDLDAWGCFELADNHIVVIKTPPLVEGGHIWANDDDEHVQDCAGGARLVFDVHTDSRADAPYAFVITDDHGNIVGFPMGNELDLSAAPPGVCEIHGFSYRGELDSSATHIDDLWATEDYERSWNRITVYRDSVAGGMVMTEMGHDTIVAPAGDPMLRFRMESDGWSPEDYVFVILDEDGVIIDFAHDDWVDAREAPVGICYVIGVAYTGVLDTTDHIDDLSASGCISFSENMVVIERIPPLVEGGEVMTVEGDDWIRDCFGGDRLEFEVDNTSRSESPYAYVITDEEGNVLGLPPGDVLDLTGAPPGVCLVYGFSYTGALDSAASHIDDLSSDEDFELSWNHITVYRDSVAAGEVNAIGRPDTIEGMAGDLGLNFLMENTSMAHAHYVYVITDELGEIFGITDDNEIIGADGEVGTYHIYGLSFTGEIDTNALYLQDLQTTGCWEVSDNYVVVIIHPPLVDGGEVWTGDDRDWVRGCAGDDDRLVFEVDNDSEAQGAYAYIITDPQGSILGMPPGHVMNLQDAPPGICFVYGFSYTGDLDSAATHINDLSSSGNYDLSDNFITAYRDDVDGAMVSIVVLGDTLVAEAGDSILDFHIQNSSMSFANYVYFATTADGEIIDLLEEEYVEAGDAPPGEYHIYGFSYTGMIDTNVTYIWDLYSDGCSELSMNHIVLIVTEPEVEGGEVFVDDHQDWVRGCAGDDMLRFYAWSTTRSEAPYAYIITNDEGDILGMPPGDFMDLSHAPPGICYIYGFSYTGELDSSATHIDDLTSDDEYELSENAITVFRDTVHGGMVSIVGGGDTIIAPAGSPDLNFFVETTADLPVNYQYVITDDEGYIIAYPPGNEIMAADAPVGICHVYGIAYTGMLDTNAHNIWELYAYGCSELSDNHVTIVRTAPLVEGGVVFTMDNRDWIRACAGDDRLEFDIYNSSRSEAPYAYVLTDADSNILAFPHGNFMDLSDAPVGLCLIYGISYVGDLDSSATHIDDLTADGDYEISENYIRVYRDTVSGGMVGVIGGTDTVEAPAGSPDLMFDVETTSNLPIPYSYVITHENGDIVGFAEGNTIDAQDAPPGICYVYGFSYTGRLDSAAQTIWDLWSDGCYELSENRITIIRVPPMVEGGLVMTCDDELDWVRACAGNDDLQFGVMNTSRSDAPYAYVITDADSNILVFPQGVFLDLSGAPAGVCRVFGISYTGMLDSSATHIDDLSSDGDYELSMNQITVYRDMVDGGEVSAGGGADSVTATVGDPSLDFEIQTTSDILPHKYAYVVTEPNGTIIDFPPGEMIFASEAPVGVCYVYGFAYSGMLDSSATTIWDLSSSGCYELSMNAVVITRQAIVSVVDLVADNLSAYPNPFTDVIAFDGNAIESVVVYNMMGDQEKEINEDFESVDMSDLRAGIYLCEVQLTDGRVRLLRINKN